MKRWRCRWYVPQLVDYADATTAAPQQQRIERHLAQCAACRDALAALRDVPRLLQRAAPPDPGDAFWVQQQQAIGRAIRSAPTLKPYRHPGTLDKPRWWRSPWHLAGAVAASLLLTLLVYRLGAPGRSTHPLEPTVRVATLDTESLLTLEDVMQVVTPAEGDLVRQGVVDENLIAELPLYDFVGGNVQPVGLRLRDLTESELNRVDELIGGIG